MRVLREKFKFKNDTFTFNPVYEKTYVVVTVLWYHGSLVFVCAISKSHCYLGENRKQHRGLELKTLLTRGPEQFVVIQSIIYLD